MSLQRISITSPACFAHNLAKLSLAREMGNADKKLDDYLKVQ
jgi:hypothetical protein